MANPSGFTTGECRFNMVYKIRILVVVPSNCVTSVSLKKKEKGASEMVQWVRALTVFPKVLSSNPSKHMVAHNHL